MCSVCWLSFGIANLREKQVPGVPHLWLRRWFCNSCVLEVFQLFSVNGLLSGLSQIEANQNTISPSWRTSGAELSHRFPPRCVWEGGGAAWSPLSFYSLFYFSPYFLQTQKGWVWFLLSTTKVRQACCLLFALRASGSPDSFGDAAAQPTCPGAAGGSFCSSSCTPALLLLKPPRNSGLGATISSALHGLSLLHP